MPDIELLEEMARDKICNPRRAAWAEQQLRRNRGLEPRGIPLTGRITDADMERLCGMPTRGRGPLHIPPPATPGWRGTVTSCPACDRRVLLHADHIGDIFRCDEDTADGCSAWLFVTHELKLRLATRAEARAQRERP